MSATIILGAGMTGLAAGVASGLPVFEALDHPGGICRSYYLRAGSSQPQPTAPEDDESYRFEIGGGHWIFGGDSLVHRFLESMAHLSAYQRRSAVYFRENDCYIPYPLQNNLRFLHREIIVPALQEMCLATTTRAKTTTMADWLQASFGPTLTRLFFDPFHQMYTAGLWQEIAPQDPYKSPVDLRQAIQGAFSEPEPVGYNARFVYPGNGLEHLARQMAARADVRYGRRVVAIDVSARQIRFQDGEVISYRTLVSTLPLNQMLAMTALTVPSPPDPAPGVLVLNIGAVRGPRCPEQHWLYLPDSAGGCHRVGFYSNVDRSFLPASARAGNDRVAIYVEKAYREGQKPLPQQITEVTAQVIAQLQQWEWIAAVEVSDPTWVEVAYTWSWPGSHWKQKALALLERHHIYQVGRYARWTFQGIADSIRDGLLAGSALSGCAR